MPDTKLSWFNIKEHIRKFFWVYVAVLTAVLVAGNLLWITTAPRVPEDQRVLIYMADEWSNPEPLNDIAADLLTRVQAEDESMREVSFESLMFSDPGRDYTGVMVLMTRLAVGEGDIFLANANAMNALVGSGACLPLDGYWSDGWLHDLEPHYAETTDDETGETVTIMAGLKLDGLNALRDMQAFNNEGAYLVIAQNGQNIDVSLLAAQYLVEDLKVLGDNS